MSQTLLSPSTFRNNNCPGCHRIEIATWKPSGSLGDSLSQHFLGGAHQLKTSELIFSRWGYSILWVFVNCYLFFQSGTIQIDNSGRRKSDGKSESHSPKLPQVIPFLVLFCFSVFSSCILPKISPHQVWNWVLEGNKQLSSTVSQHGRHLEEKSEKAFSPAAPCVHQSTGGYINY